MLDLEIHMCVEVNPVSNRFTNMHAQHFKVWKKSTMHSSYSSNCAFNVCICMYVAMCDIIYLVGYRLLCHQSKRICRRPNSHHQSAHICHYQKWPNSKCGHANQTSSNQTHEPSTCGSSIVIKLLLLLQGQPLRTLHQLNYQSLCHWIQHKT